MNNEVKITVDPRKSLEYVLVRQTTALFKEFLYTLEKNESKHTESLNKLYQSLPDDYKTYVDLADWLTEEESQRLRKEVLRRGNDTIRALQEELDKYDVDFKK